MRPAEAISLACAAWPGLATPTWRHSANHGNPLLRPLCLPVFYCCNRLLNLSKLWLSFLCFLDQSYLYRCTLPKKNGRCSGSFPRFYFNFKTKKCEEFLYGGCGGNKNNFLTQDECFSKCEDQSYLYRCTLPKITGPCRAAFSRFYFNHKSQKCEEFLYGGCRGNENNFLTQQECFEKCEDQSYLYRCTLPKKKGRCRGSLPRFYFNFKTKKCEEFLYGGCRGNKNNFLTQQECFEKCEDQSYSYRCTLPKITGPCRAAFSRFYFNLKSKKCEEFPYGGCRGNENNFLTQQECFEKCEDQTYLYRCTLPKRSGPCRGSFPRFYFNMKSKKCEEFRYGGCKGNENNFFRRHECLSKCEGVPLKPDDDTDFSFVFVEE
ncbi:actinia tenebrosa protease inhibitors-like [Anolis sagrei]|uniref:actinia tenebrosa protease inhibitors-like n=1 Tax=Anolis sagrei TaxID=38937 RepID=UPI0035207958